MKSMPSVRLLVRVLAVLCLVAFSAGRARGECWSDATRANLVGVAQDGSFLIVETQWIEAAVRSEGSFVFRAPDGKTRLQVEFCTEEGRGCLKKDRKVRVLSDGDPALVAQIKTAVANDHESENLSYEEHLQGQLSKALGLTPAKKIKAKLLRCGDGYCVEQDGKRSGMAKMGPGDLETSGRKTFYKHPRSSLIFVVVKHYGKRVHQIADCQDTAEEIHWVPAP
jgi:hypothetical protein